MEPVVTDIHKNQSRVRSILDKAAQSNVDVLVLPELCNSGYVFENQEEALFASEEISTGVFSNDLLNWSKSNRLVVAGICEKRSHGLYNSAAVFANGSHILTYRKIHLFLNEKDWFIPGNEEPPVFQFNGARFGVMICFDWAFPEVARVLALKGAQVILHPSNLVLPFCQNAMVIRSIENSVFTATANRIGTERGVVFSGNSQITDTNGTRLATVLGDEVGLAYADINPSLADDKSITKRNDLIMDRRPELYTRLITTD